MLHSLFTLGGSWLVPAQAPGTALTPGAYSNAGQPRLTHEMMMARLSLEPCLALSLQHWFFDHNYPTSPILLSSLNHSLTLSHTLLSFELTVSLCLSHLCHFTLRVRTFTTFPSFHRCKRQLGIHPDKRSNPRSSIPPNPTRPQQRHRTVKVTAAPLAAPAVHCCTFTTT